MHVLRDFYCTCASTNTTFKNDNINSSYSGMRSVERGLNKLFKVNCKWNQINYFLYTYIYIVGLYIYILYFRVILYRRMSFIWFIARNAISVQYDGSTITEFKIRFRNHKSTMKTIKKTCEVALHFNRTPHI